MPPGINTHAVRSGLPPDFVLSHSARCDACARLCARTETGAARANKPRPSLGLLATFRHAKSKKTQNIPKTGKKQAAEDCSQVAQGHFAKGLTPSTKQLKIIKHNAPVLYKLSTSKCPPRT